MGLSPEEMNDEMIRAQIYGHVGRMMARILPKSAWEHEMPDAIEKTKRMAEALYAKFLANRTVNGP